jgi:hypothetical protein
MALDDAFTITTSRKFSPENTTSTSEEKLLIDLHQFISPEILLIKNVSCVHFAGNSSGQILETLASKAARDGREVLVSNINLFELDKQLPQKAEGLTPCAFA